MNAPDFATMTDAQINEAAARAMGWTRVYCSDYQEPTWGWFDADGRHTTDYAYETPFYFSGTHIGLFDPAHDLNHSAEFSAWFRASEREWSREWNFAMLSSVIDGTEFFTYGLEFIKGVDNVIGFTTDSDNRARAETEATLQAHWASQNG